jgi:hypothetical protein
MSLVDAVDGSSAGTSVPWMWALLRLPRFRGESHADDHDNRGLGMLDKDVKEILIGSTAMLILALVLVYLHQWSGRRTPSWSILIDLPPGIACAFAEDMRAYFAEIDHPTETLRLPQSPTLRITCFRLIVNGINCSLPIGSFLKTAKGLGQRAWGRRWFNQSSLELFCI